MSKEIDYKSAYESVLILKDMLIKENQQLKEELQKADSITQSCIFDGKEESEINFRKALNLITQYKSVLDEIRAYINNIPYKDLEPIEVQVISKILDKVKE